MYQYNQIPMSYSQSNDERFGFLGPFLLGGITGGLVAPYFYNGFGNQQYYNNNYYPYYPNYYYRPYY